MKFRLSIVVPLVVVALGVRVWSALPTNEVVGVAELRAMHRGGQTFLTWREATHSQFDVDPSVDEVRSAQRRLSDIKGISYRIYRSASQITSVSGLQPVAEVPPLSGWNTNFYGINPKPVHRALRYVIQDGGLPLPADLGLYVYNTPREGYFYYAVTVSVGGHEETRVDSRNNLATPILESVGQGVPVLQRSETPAVFNYVRSPTLDYYVRWESPPNSNRVSVAYDYVVGTPSQVRKPAPVGLHLHGWGASLNGGFGWWLNAEQGAMLLASNQMPYDWWTGYHEGLFTGRAMKTPAEWGRGVVRPYSQNRVLSFLGWMRSVYSVDLSRTFVGGNSMGGAGALMLAIRRPTEVAWALSWVGVHRPRDSPRFRSSYELVFGKPEWNVRFEDGTPVWDYFDDVWYLRQHPDISVGFLTFSNGKNDGGIGWGQAAEFAAALQDTRQPHMFVWGQGGHGQRPIMPGDVIEEREMRLDIRTDQSLPAFTSCSLDQNPGNGDPADGDPTGQVNAFLTWETTTILDEPLRWEVNVALTKRSPADTALVDVTPRRTQRFVPGPGEIVDWTASDQKGRLVVDQWGRATVERLEVSKRGVRLHLKRRAATERDR